LYGRGNMSEVGNVRLLFVVRIHNADADVMLDGNCRYPYIVH